MGHDHKKGAVPLSKLYLEGTRLRQKKILLGRTGSFLRGYVPDQPSYVAKAQLKPCDLGVIKIELTPRRNKKNGQDDYYVDIHCSV